MTLIMLSLQEETEGTTRMTLVQTRFPTADMEDDFTDGWSDILDALQAIAARAARTA